MILLLSAQLHAELPPPDYGVMLTEAAGKEVSRQGVEQSPKDAESFAKRWQSVFGPSARVTYELGLVWRLAGDDAHARRYLDEAVALDPHLTAARYDRGEVRLAAGELAGAKEDFEAVTLEEPNAWAGWFRLAHLDGLAHAPRPFEDHLQRAIRLGFTIGAVAQDPTWRGFLEDPDLGPPLVRLIRVYQGEAALDEFRGVTSPR